MSLTSKTTYFVDKLARLSSILPIARTVAIALLNILFLIPGFKALFEKYIFNPYYLPSVDTTGLTRQKETLLSRMDTDVAGKTLLELGPGGDCTLSCQLLALGVKKIYLIDNENHINPRSEDVARYKEIFQNSITDGGNFNPDCIDILCYGKNGEIPLPDKSLDIIFSNAVLEHVENPQSLLQETHRVLKDGGMAYHQTDYRDHIASQTSLWFLTIPKTLFNFLFWRTGMWTNRLRHYDWLALFEKTGWHLLDAWLETATLHSVPKSVKRRLRKENWSITSAAVLLKK
jgi:SAM-dependent methyltransferase